MNFYSSCLPVEGRLVNLKNKNSSRVTSYTNEINNFNEMKKSQKDSI